MIDLLETDGLLRGGVPIRLTYHRSDPNFYLLVDNTTQTKNYRFTISKIGLYVSVVRVNESVLPMLEPLCDINPARYYFNSLICKKYNIAKGSYIFNVLSLYDGKIPQRILLAFHKQAAVVGNKLLSPFFTSNSIKIKEVKILHNGYAVRQVRPNIHTGEYVLCYRDFVNFVGCSSEPYMITHNDYPKGYRFIAFDFMDGCDDECASEVLLTGCLSLEVEFDSAVDEPHVLLVYGVSPDSMDIDSSSCARISRTVM